MVNHMVVPPCVKLLIGISQAVIFLGIMSERALPRFRISDVHDD